MPDAEDKSTRSGHLISLLRRLIEYGKELAAALRNPTPKTDFDRLVRPFGTRDVALILARITRGLQLAGALETRIVAIAARLDVPPAAAARTTGSPAQREPAEPRPPRSPPRPTDPRLVQMPTPDAIAAQVRRRPIGAVIVDICLALGIMPRDPLWNEIRKVVDEFRGNYAALVIGMLDQSFSIPIEERSPPASALPAAASTGPPHEAA